MKENKRPLNDEIKASKVKLITDEGEVIWEMSLSDAKQKAREAHMSPVFEISNNQVKLSRHTGFWAKVSAFFSWIFY